MNTSCKHDEAPDRTLNDVNLAFDVLKKYQEQIQQYLPNSAAMAEIARKMNEFVPTEKHQHHDQYDIFLSYRSVDYSHCEDLKNLFEGLNYKVYWDRDDPVLKDKPVTKETAAHLRSRMRCCRALVFAVSSHFDESLWMPWELGFFDGRTGLVFVYPLDEGIVERKPRPQYLDFYPWIDAKNVKAWLENHPLDEGIVEHKISPQNLNIDGENVKAWLEHHLPHKEPAIPWGPAGPDITEDYGNWFARNSDRIMSDPKFAMELLGNLWQAWFRLSLRTTDRSE